MDRQLTAEEHDKIFRLRTILQAWGLAADELPVEECLFTRGFKTIAEIGDYRVRVDHEFVILWKRLQGQTNWAGSFPAASRYYVDKEIRVPEVNDPALMPPMWVGHKTAGAHVTE